MNTMQIGDPFNHDGRSYRITGFVKEIEIPFQGENDPNPRKRIMYQALVHLHNGKTSVRRKVWCVANEAQWVNGYGICGVELPVADVVVTGRVNWPSDLLEQEILGYEGFIGETLY